MKNTFKIGDKVRCVNNAGADLLKLNKIYTVIRADDVCIHIDDVGGYFSTRFEFVEEEDSG